MFVSLALIFGLLASPVWQEAATVCGRLHSSSLAADLVSVPSSFAVCLNVAKTAHEEAVPMAVAVAVAYHETRMRPEAVGSGGELGVLQAKPRWYPLAKTQPLIAGLRALHQNKAMGRTLALKLCGRLKKPGSTRRCRRRVHQEDPWLRAMAHFKGGIYPSWWYVQRVDRLRRAL